MNSPSPEPSLRAYLLGVHEPHIAGQPGRWRLERDLLNRADGTRGTFSGVVIFTPTDDDGLALREEGTMRWPSFTGPASREYVLKPVPQPDALDVFFPDGRPFHRMSFTPDTSQDTHWCDPDTYRVSYTRQGPDAFSYSWDVTGPRKDLLLVSRLARITA
ncbi:MULTISPECIES: DUF6314 family protein [unclassified Arthrobacter]|uniref:DUF6314 family protein n=1 Tax=unclassified Arthrobacter TaxID=235627 RepID=UPI001CC75238|nr:MULTISPECIES: DUF6314 family protein [unclassified Arthrobacter]MDE8588663.1 DUF6314 family protein [Arthrobacter sp. NQ4]BCW81603.1 hypothetical protein NicSoilC5_36220 [Arthrobacter sp. NicSoilC5]